MMSDSLMNGECLTIESQWWQISKSKWWLTDTKRLNITKMPEMWAVKMTKLWLQILFLGNCFLPLPAFFPLPYPFLPLSPYCCLFSIPFLLSLIFIGPFTIYFISEGYNKFWDILWFTCWLCVYFTLIGWFEYLGGLPNHYFRWPVRGLGEAL